LFALPSENDPLPTVTLEAMAMRLPVVGMHSGGIPEMVIDGKTGLLVHSPDSNSFAEAIVELLSSFERLKTMGEESYKHVQEKFRASLWADNLQKVYQKVLQKKICVVEFPGRGGMIHYAYQLCTGLFKVGFNVTLVTGEDYELDDMPHNFKVEKILKLWNPKSNESLNKLVRFLRRIWRAVKYYYSWVILFHYLKRERPDFVQFGEIRFPTDWFPLQLIRLSGCKLIDICHNISPFDISGDSKRFIKTSTIYQMFYKGIYQSFSEIFVHSQDSRKKFLEIYGGNTERLHVIPHGNQNMFLNLENEQMTVGELRQELNITNDARVALFFGTITKYKGVEDLLKSFVRVREKIEKARLIIVGFPNADVDIEALVRLVEELGIEDSVTLHMKYVANEKVPAFFNLADIVVYPYRMIYQSGAIQVAYSFGKAVVATKVGGLPEVVDNNVTGLLVEPNDTKALSEAIIKLLGDPQLSASLGKGAQEASKTIYSWERIAEMIKDVYLEKK
jgi:glycosyltransferase involved in cell wall biosynthesis